MTPANDNAPPPPARYVPVVGYVGEHGKVTLTRPLPSRPQATPLRPVR